MKNQLKYFIVIGSLVMLSCGSDEDYVPEGVIAKEKMIEVMVDVELTQALIKLKTSTRDTINERQIYNEVYNTYSISEEDFNNSLKYYCKKPKLLLEMYGLVIENLTKKQSEQQRK